MDAHKPDLFHPFGRGKLDVATRDQWLIVLGNLIVLWHVGIEIILAGEPTARHNLAMTCQRCLDSAFDDASVQHWQHTRQSQTDRAGLRSGWCPKPGAAPAKDLRARRELGVHLEPDHDLVVHGPSPL